MLHHSDKNKELGWHISVQPCQSFQAPEICGIFPFQAKPFNTFVTTEGFRLIWYKSSPWYELQIFTMDFHPTSFWIMQSTVTVAILSPEIRHLQNNSSKYKSNVLFPFIGQVHFTLLTIHSAWPVRSWELQHLWSYCVLPTHVPMLNCSDSAGYIHTALLSLYQGRGEKDP